MKYDELASKESLQKTVDGLKSRGYEVDVAVNGKEALEKIKTLIPDGASVMNGASVTLEQIGYVDFLKNGAHKWDNLHAKVIAENDRAKRSILRKQASLSDYYLGSVHALTEAGEFVVASNTGSQLSHIVFTSANLIFVVSTKKIVPNLDEAMKRLESYVVPLEDEHMKKLYGFGTHLNKILIFRGESPTTKRKVRFILVKEDLGF